MTAKERTTDIYEQLPHYPKPPLIPLPEWGDFESLSEMGIEPGELANLIVRTAMVATGFRKFYEQLPQNLEGYLRKSNLRGGGLFAPVNSASLALADDPRPLTPEERAVTLIFAAYQIYDDLLSGKFKPDTYKGQILEMGQYPNLFSTSLIIEGKNVRIFKSQKTNQITVIINGRYFLLDVGHPGQDTTPPQLIKTLNNLVQFVRNENKTYQKSIGILTGSSRAAQLQLFSKLLRIPENREAFQLIRHSFLTLCLDLNSEPKSYAEAAFLAQSRNFHNRWFHSSLQIVVYRNSKACTICNFNAYVDGNPMMRGSSELQTRARRFSIEAKENSVQPDLPNPKELKWQLDEILVDRALKDIEWVQDNQQATFEIKGIGRKYFTTRNIAPIPVFIIAVEMAAKQLVGKHLGIMQYLTLSKYRCGDLANANATTPAVKRLVDYIENDHFDLSKAVSLLHEAIESQRQAYRQARKYLSLSKIISLFLYSPKGIKRLYISLVLACAVLTLRILGKFKNKIPDIVASHPDIYPEVPVVGRSGIRLPYIKYFGIHYQIMEDKIIITFMPSVKWKIPNDQLCAKIEDNLEKVKSIIEANANQEVSFIQNSA